jgi:hypothetical protein
MLRGDWLDPLAGKVSVQHMPAETSPGCTYEEATGWGDRRPVLTARHQAADNAREYRAAGARLTRVRAGRACQQLIE